MLTKNIFDSHAHYNDPAFNEDYVEVLDCLPQKGVECVVNVGYNLDISRLAQKQSTEYPYVYFTAGIHPHDCENLPRDYLEQIKLLAQDEKCVAIGEIGLDYCRNEVPHDLQKKVFLEQMSLAKSMNIPVIIHTREATLDTLEAIKLCDYNNGVVHCFSSSAETATELVKLGWYIGFTGVVTFSNAKKAVRAAEAVPLDKLLVETDCPYMAPVPYRGKRCTSDMIIYTAEKLAEIKGISTEQMLNITSENAKRLYKIEM